jgi:hypothetical protein
MGRFPAKVAALPHAARRPGDLARAMHNVTIEAHEMAFGSSATRNDTKDEEPFDGPLHPQTPRAGHALVE